MHCVETNNTINDCYPDKQPVSGVRKPDVTAFKGPEPIKAPNLNCRKLKMQMVVARSSSLTIKCRLTRILLKHARQPSKIFDFAATGPKQPFVRLQPWRSLQYQRLSRNSQRPRAGCSPLARNSSPKWCCDLACWVCGNFIYLP